MAKLRTPECEAKNCQSQTDWNNSNRAVLVVFILLPVIPLANQSTTHIAKNSPNNPLTIKCAAGSPLAGLQVALLTSYRPPQGESKKSSGLRFSGFFCAALSPWKSRTFKDGNSARTGLLSLWAHRRWSTLVESHRAFPHHRCSMLGAQESRQ